MKILELNATFGRLNKATLRPGDGLTLIEAPNEWGKSTWCAFLRAMLYGFPQRDRDKAGYLAEKTRYQPWSGGAMEGTAILEWRGRSLTLYRGPRGSVPWGAFSAVWTASGEKVDGLTAENCGETLTGVSREVFERTAFVGQGGAFLSPSGELEKRVAALATSGEEEVSYSQVERRLLDWRNRRKVNVRVGLIPELEKELSAVNEAMSRQSELLIQARAARQEKEALERQKAGLEEDLRAFAALKNARQREKHTQAQADYDAALGQVQALEKKVRAFPPAETLRAAQGDLSYLNTVTANLRMADKAVPAARERAAQAREAVQAVPWFGGMEPAQAAVKAQADCGEAKRLQKKGLAPLSLLGAPVGMALGTLLFRLVNGQWAVHLPSLVLGSLVGWLIVALPLFLYSRSKKKKLSALLARYNTQTPEDILDRADAYAQLWAGVQEAERELKAVETERDRLREQQAGLTGSLLDMVHTFEPGVTDLFGVSAAISRALQFGEKYSAAQAELRAAEKLLSALPSPEGESVPLPAAIPQGDPREAQARLAQVSAHLSQAVEAAARLQGELNTLGDPADLAARRDALREELEKRRREYDALTVAMDALKEADSRLREKFSPAVNRRAGEYLSALTGGKYDRAAFTRQFQALAQEAGEAVPRPDLALSGGTAQQLYLAVRLAMCELALPQADPCPILLDDVLAPFDDHRAALALDCLQEVARTRQVLLFSCHSRERGLLKGTGATVAATK